MSKQQSLFQSLAASGAVLITFVGVCHEVIGARLFPWAPATIGSAIGWHGIGVWSMILLFAVTVFLAAIGTAFFHREALRLNGHR